jgi:hypothetical protein
MSAETCLANPEYRHAFDSVFHSFKNQQCVHLPVRHAPQQERPLLWLGGSTYGDWSRGMTKTENYKKLADHGLSFLNGAQTENYRRSPFWRILDKILQAYSASPEEQPEYIWSNIFKGGCMGNSVLPYSQRDHQAEDCATLLKIEIEQ